MNKRKRGIIAALPGVEKVITGWWDGEPIWRVKTAEEKLFEELARRNSTIVEKLKKETHD